MDGDVFDSVAWRDTKCALKGKLRMRQLWYGKQGASTCATRDRWSPVGQPAQISWIDDITIKLVHSDGALLPPGPPPAQVFQSLEARPHSWGGEWMWDDFRAPDNTTWVATALEAGILVCVIGGSYNKSKALDISSTGWIIHDKASSRQIRGSFVEQSPETSSYRGELLGMLAIHLVLLTIDEQYGIEGLESQVYCDNKGVLFTFVKSHKHVPAEKANSDILCILRRLQGLTKSVIKHKYIKDHQDDNTRRDRLILEAHLKCICDEIAKQGTVQAMINTVQGPREGGRYQPLPKEVASVYIGEDKQTSDLIKSL